MGQIWGAGLSEELDLDDAEGPHAGDSTAGLCLIQPMVIAWVGNPAQLSHVPLCPPSQFPVWPGTLSHHFVAPVVLVGPCLLLVWPHFGPVLPPKMSVTLILRWRHTQAHVPQTGMS